MKYFILLILLLACLPAPTPLHGDYFRLVNYRSCNEVLSFRADDYVHQIACTLNDGNIGIIARTGTFEVIGTSIVFNREQSTCAADDRRPAEYTLIQDVDGITLSDDDGTARFERFRSAPVLGVRATFGCFGADGLFIARPLKVIQ